MRDTSRASQARYEALITRLTPEERLETVNRLNAAVRELALAGIDRAHPGASPRLRQALLAERLYGTDVARRLFGDVLDVES